MDALRCKKPPMCVKAKFQIISYAMEPPLQQKIRIHGNLEYRKNDIYIDFFQIFKHLLM